MTNENLKVGDVIQNLLDISNKANTAIYLDQHDQSDIDVAINLIKSQQSHIEILESAIREFLSWTCYKDDEPDYLDALQNLRNLMENKVEIVKGRDGNAGRFLHQWAYEAFGRGEDVQVEYPANTGYREIHDTFTLNLFNNQHYKFRLKPETIQIGSRTIVKPISVKPEIGQTFYVSSIASMGKFLSDKWKNSDSQNEMLVRNLCHLNAADAINHAEVILELME